MLCSDGGDAAAVPVAASSSPACVEPALRPASEIQVGNNFARSGSSREPGLKTATEKEMQTKKPLCLLLGWVLGSAPVLGRQRQSCVGAGSAAQGSPGDVFLLWALWSVDLCITGLEQAGSLSKTRPWEWQQLWTPQLHNGFHLPFPPLTTEFHKSHLVSLALLLRGTETCSSVLFFKHFFPF